MPRPRISGSDLLGWLNAGVAGMKAEEVAVEPPPPAPPATPLWPPEPLSAPTVPAGTPLAHPALPEIYAGVPLPSLYDSMIDLALRIKRTCHVAITPGRVDVKWPDGRHWWITDEGGRWVSWDPLFGEGLGRAVELAARMLQGERFPVHPAHLAMFVHELEHGPYLP